MASSSKSSVSTREGPAQRGIQSIEVGGQLLRALVHHGRPMALKDLAREAEMAAAKAPPYMVSFGRLGLIEQDSASGHYRLGPLALQLGLIGLQQADPVHIATPLMAPLAEQIGQTVGLAVWGARGATMVHIAEAPSPVHVSLRHGYRLLADAHRLGPAVRGLPAPPRSAGCWRTNAAARSSARSDAPAQPGLPPVQPLPSWSAFETQLDEVRAHGASRSENEVIPRRQRHGRAGVRPHQRHRAGRDRDRSVGHLRHPLGHSVATALVRCARQGVGPARHAATGASPAVGPGGRRRGIAMPAARPNVPRPSLVDDGAGAAAGLQRRACSIVAKRSRSGLFLYRCSGW